MEKEFDLSKIGTLISVDSRCWWGKSTKKVLGGTADLIDLKKLSGLKSIRTRGDRFLAGHSFPFTPIRGVRFVPFEFLPIVETELYGIKRDFNLETKKFLSWYVDHINDKKNRKFALTHYPDRESVNDKFEFTWIKLDITPTQNNISEFNREKEAKKQERKIKEFCDFTVTSLTENLYTILSNIESRERTGKTITKKQVEALERYCENFDSFNISKNLELTKITNICKKVLWESPEKMKPELLSEAVGKTILRIQNSSNKLIQVSDID